MATKTRLVLILLLAIALDLRVCITQRNTQLLSGYTAGLLPKQLIFRPGVDLPLTPFEVALLAPDGGRIIQRSYGQDDTILWLAAVQSRSDWRVQHPPQVCYTAQGWRIEDQSVKQLRDQQGTHDIQRMLVSKDDERRVVYYFYTDGRRWTASYFRRVMDALLDRAIYAQASTWMLIQISTPLSDPDAETRVISACVELFDQAP